MPSRPTRLAAAVLLAACATRASAPVAPVLAPEPTQTVPDRPAAPPVALSYAELVNQAAAREDPGQDGPAGCLLESDGPGLRLSGFSSPALRPLPAPPPDLDAALARSISVNVLTPFGRYGEAPEALSLASFTYLPPTRDALALIVTDHGVALRGSAASVPMRDKLSSAAAAEAVASLAPTSVYVSAEAATPTRALAELLEALSAHQVPSALAVALAPDTRLPAPSRAPEAGTCADGLPETSEPEGGLDASALTPAITQLRASAASCLTSASPRAARGGKVNLLLRVGASGALSAACIDHDDIGDGALRACILGEARKLSFPAPAPRGSVDFALPLSLVPKFAPAAPLLCPRAAAAR